MAMNIPFVGFQPIKTSEHMASAGVFGLLQVEYFSLVVLNYEFDIFIWFCTS